MKRHGILLNLRGGGPEPLIEPEHVGQEFSQRGKKQLESKAARQLGCYCSVIQTSPQPSPNLGEGAVVRALRVTSAGEVKKRAFTLAEVLITLGIIGVVAAISIPSLITKINNKGYAEQLIKTYSILQNVTNKIIEEEGAPSTWRWVIRGTDADDAANDRIIDLYKNKLKVVHYCKSTWGDSKCVDRRSIKYRGLDKQGAPNIYNNDRVNTDIFGDYQVVLPDGVVIGFRFSTKTNAVYWGMVSALGFTVDINGKKKPNVVGRDIFYFYLDKATGKVLPFINNESTNKNANTCEVDKSGASCAYRVITEGKMNY